MRHASKKSKRMEGSGGEDHFIQGGREGLRDIPKGNEAGPYGDLGIECFNRGNSGLLKERRRRRKIRKQTKRQGNRVNGGGVGWW